MKRIMMTTALIATAMAATITMAQPGEGQHGRAALAGKHGFEALNLSDEQKEKIHNLKTESKKEGITLQAKQKVARIELHELLAADNPNKGKIDAKIAAISKMNETALRNRVDLRLALQQVLTPEQRKTAKELGLFAGKKGQKRHFRGGKHRKDGQSFRGPRPGGPGASNFPLGAGEDEQEEFDENEM